MMKKVFVVLLLILGAAEVKSIELKIAASQTNALVQFLIACQQGNTNSSLYQQLMASKYNTENTRTMLKKWDELEKHNMLQFEGFPETRHSGRSVIDLIVIQSARAKNASELAQQCMGYFTQPELKKFKEILLYFEPIYRELFWQPNLKAIHTKLKQVQEYVKQKNIQDLFNKAAAFYGAKWDDEFPFYVLINPLAGKVTYTTARPMGQVLIADLVLTENDLAGWLGVVFHEMCHVLYNSQSRETQEALEKYFTTHAEVGYRLPAYNWFNEAMATALGNGWLVEKLTGRIDSTEWYNNNYINRFAHVIYPLVKEYAEAGIMFDGNFVDRCISLFKEEFRGINTEPEHLFTFINMAADTMPASCYNELFKYFRPRSLDCETPLTINSLEKVGAGIATKVLVITSDKKQKLTLISEKMGLGCPLNDKPCIYYFLEENGTNYFVLALNDINDFGKAIKTLSKQPVFGETRGVIEVE